jgi:hypothetical protein
MHPAILTFGLDVKAGMTIEIFFVQHGGLLERMNGHHI